MKRVLAIVLSMVVLLGSNFAVMLMNADATSITNNSGSLTAGDDVDIDLFEPDPGNPSADPYGWVSYSTKTKTFETTTEVTAPTGQQVYKLTLSGVTDGSGSAQAYTTNKKALQKNTTYELSAWVKSDIENTRLALYVPTTATPYYSESSNDYAYDWSSYQVGAYHLKYQEIINNVAGSSTAFSTLYLRKKPSEEVGATADGWTKMAVKFTTDNADVCAKDVSVALRLSNANGLLYFSDVQLVQFAPEVTPANVTVETGTDGGYVTNVDNAYTAVPYEGNTFLGWYNASGVQVSTELTKTFTGADGAITAKFKNNSLFASPGYEQTPTGSVVYKDNSATASGWHCSASWAAIDVVSGVSHSGTKSLKFLTPWQEDVYTNLANLKPNTYYTVSYYWMMPNANTGDSYRGMVACKQVDATGNPITTSSKATANSLGQAYNASGELPSAKVWKQTKFEFNTGDLTSVKLLLAYNSTTSTNLYIDEFTVFETPAGVHTPEYKAVVSAEKDVNGIANGSAYVSNDALVAEGTTINVAADANKGYQFDGWYENNVKVSLAAKDSFIIAKNRTLVAKFVPTADSANYFDVDGDNFINNKDAVAIRNHILGKATLKGMPLSRADINKDGKVSVTDIVMLRKSFDGSDDGSSNPKNSPEYIALKASVLNGTYQKMLDDSIDNEGNMVRIANAMRKAQSGQKVTVGFIGGSITEGATAGGEANRYANLVKDWWVSKFGADKVDFVNVGIGSTTSLLGVHRVVDDLLSKNPDFVVVDFTTNDAGGDPQYRVPYENLVRRILEYPTQPGLLTVYYGPTNSDKYKQGIYERALNAESAHKPTGLFYDVPIINYYNTLWQYIDAGVVTWPEVAADYIHPNTAGHKMASACINNYLSKVYSKLSTIDTVAPSLPSEFFWGSNLYMNAELKDGTKLTADSKTNFADDVIFAGGQDRWKSWRCDSATGEITFTLSNCKTFTVMNEMISIGGSADVYINGAKYTTIYTKNDGYAYDPANPNKQGLNWAGFTYNTPDGVARDLVVQFRVTNNLIPSTTQYGRFTITSFLCTSGSYTLPSYTATTTTLKSLSQSVKIDGRTSWNNNDLQLDWMGSGFELAGNLSGEVKLNYTINSTEMNTYVIVDGDYANATQKLLTSSSGEVVLANLAPGKHKVQFFKATEATLGAMNITGITYNGQLYQKPINKPLKIEFIGDSITSASSLLKNTDQPDRFLNQDGIKSYATLTAKALNADFNCISKSGLSVIANTPNVFDYFENTNYRESTTKWDFASNQVDVVVINLGTNDTPTYVPVAQNGLGQDQAVLKQGIKNMLALARSKYPKAKIVWVYGMMDTRISEVYQAAVSETVAETSDTNISFKLLNRNNCDGQDGHPTKEGQEKAATDLTTYLKSLLG